MNFNFDANFKTGYIEQVDSINLRTALNRIQDSLK